MPVSGTVILGGHAGLNALDRPEGELQDLKSSLVIREDMHFQHAGPRAPFGLWDQTGHHQGRALPVLNGEEQGLILLGRIVIIPAIQVTGDQVIPNLGLYIPAEQQIPGIRASGGSASGGRSSAAWRAYRRTTSSAPSPSRSMERQPCSMRSGACGSSSSEAEATPPPAQPDSRARSKRRGGAGPAAERRRVPSAQKYSPLFSSSSIRSPRMSTL